MPVSVVVGEGQTKKEAQALMLEYFKHASYIKCDRCKQIKEGSVWEDGSSGCYVVDDFLGGFWNPGEHIVCDPCMWSDPRYIKVYGRVVFA